MNRTKHKPPTSGQLVRFLEAIGNRERQRSANVVSPDDGATVVGSPADDTPARATNTGGVLSPDDIRAADLLLIQQMRAVICDFLPNVGVCVLQNYGLLNSVLVDSRRVLTEAGMVVPEGRQ
jgi:hypothetical protein